MKIFCALLVAAFLTVAVPAQVPDAGRPTSTPYAGDLSIFEEPGRDARLQIDRVMTILHVAPGSTVADIGAGGGWFTVRAARRVGPAGRVYGEDISPAAIKAMDDRARKENLPQMKAVLGTPDDAKLPPGAVNAVLLLKAYHEIAAPVTFMQRLRKSLAAGARVGIIDRNGNGADHGLNIAVLRKEMREAGYREVEHYDFTKADGQDYFLVFVVR